MSLIRDSIAGQVIRRASGGRCFQYAEQRDPSIWEQHMKPEDSEDSGELVVDPSRRTYTYDANGKKVHLIVWWGEKDQDNPMHWPEWRKFFVTLEICLFTFSVYIGSAIYTAGIPSLTKEFRISSVAGTLGLTFYVAGYGLGPLVWSPMSEIPQIGRNPVYILTLVVFVALQVPTALAGNLGTLLAFRFLTGFFGSPALATGGASITDMYKPSKQAYGMVIWGISAVCGPVLGLLVGGFVAQSEGWR